MLLMMLNLPVLPELYSSLSRPKVVVNIIICVRCGVTRAKYHHCLSVVFSMRVNVDGKNDCHSQHHISIRSGEGWCLPEEQLLGTL